MGLQLICVKGKLEDDVVDALGSLGFIWIESVSRAYEVIAFQPDLCRVRSAVDDSANHLKFLTSVKDIIAFPDQCERYLVYASGHAPDIKTLQRQLNAPLTVVKRDEVFVVFGVGPVWNSPFHGERPRRPRCAKLNSNYLFSFDSLRERFPTLATPRPKKLKTWQLTLTEPGEAVTPEQVEDILSFNDGTPVFLLGTDGRSVSCLGSDGSQLEQIRG
ncbi:MAG: hypothetical protein LC650_04115 [Actinobacteria bacterium]|nr:hypothetical protein [Actinomycetota bacterium]